MPRQARLDVPGTLHHVIIRGAENSQHRNILKPIQHYVRVYLPGSSYFFMVALLERHRRLLTERIDALRETFRSVPQKHHFRIDAMSSCPIIYIVFGRCHPMQWTTPCAGV